MKEHTIFVQNMVGICARLAQPMRLDGGRHNETIRCSRALTSATTQAAMFKRHVLAALAAGIPANDEDVARSALKRVDPLARGFARRKLETALIDAALACDAAQLRTPAPAHVMRLAALDVAGSRADAADEAGVAVAYTSLATPSLPRFPLLTLLALLSLLSVAGGIAFFIATRPGPAPRTYVRPLPPPSADAFAKGGTPLHDPAIDTLLKDKLTDFVVDANRSGGNDRERLVKALHAPEPLLIKSKQLAKAWDAMLAAFDHAVEVAENGGPKGRDYDDIREAVREMSAAFIEAGLGYHLEGRFKRGRPIIQAYNVEQVVYVVTDGAPRRVLSLRRLDNLNTSWAVLGMHDEDMGDPVLHLDRIDINVASFVLPILAGGQPYPLADHEWMLWPEHKALATQIGDALRAEYVAALDKDAKNAQKIAALLVKRGDIIDEWRDKLGRRDIYFITTDELFVPQTLLDSLEGKVPNHQRRKVSEIDGQLAALQAPRIHARMHDMIAASVRRHEAQHGFDYDRDTDLKYPAALEQMLGAPHDSDGDERRIVSSARAELSAYLSQIINDPATPQASLWHLGRQVFDRDRWGTGEFYAGLVILEGIAKQLGADISTPRYVKGLDRDRLSAFAKLIASQPSDKLRAAAKALWADLYGGPATTITDAPPPTRLAQH
jgi:hypothetical protein